jgi:hypothetical protein
VIKTATLTISIDVEVTDDPFAVITDDGCKELLLEVVASQSDQALMGYITVKEATVLAAELHVVPKEKS